MGYILADCLSRFFKRLHDGSTFLGAGGVEYSPMVFEKSQEMGINPKEYVNQMHEVFDKTFSGLDLIIDGFVQNSDPKHHWTANLVWDKLASKNLIYKKLHTGMYCPECCQFYDVELGSVQNCPVHKNLKLVQQTKEAYFFKLSAFQGSILEYLQSVAMNDESVRRQLLEWAQNIKDVIISRDKKNESKGENSENGTNWGVSVWLLDKDAANTEEDFLKTDSGDEYHPNPDQKSMEELEKLRSQLKNIAMDKS